MPFCNFCRAVYLYVYREQNGGADAVAECDNDGIFLLIVLCEQYENVELIPSCCVFAFHVRVSVCGFGCVRVFVYCCFWWWCVC